MKGQTSSGLWILVIGLIALFMVATMVAPALMNQTKGGASGGTNNGDNTAQTLMFDAPTVALGTASLAQGQRTDLTVRAAPTTTTTGDGGSFAWLISIEGANGQGNGFQVHYGEQLVQWFAGENGSIVGIGPRFSQGPGAASVEVSAPLSIVANMAGSFTVKAWIAEAKDLVTLDPTNLKARSPAQSQSFHVAANIPTGVTVTHSLSGPATAREDSYVTYALATQAYATGKWRSSITVNIAIAKSGIRSSDVLARVTTGRSSQSITWTDTGDRLVGKLSTSSPFQGVDSSESAAWTTSFEIEFRTSAEYTIECWSEETSTGNDLGSAVSHDVEVRRTVSTAPAVMPSEPAVNQTSPSTGNVTGTAPASDLNDPALPVATNSSGNRTNST